MKGFLKYFLFLILPLTVIVLWLSGVLNPRISPGEVKEKHKVITGFTVLPVTVSNNASFRELDANVVAKNQAAIATRIMGKVLEVPVKNGECVKAGTLLVKIDTSDIQGMAQQAYYGQKQAEDALKAAKANLDVMSKTYNRFKKLLSENAVTKQEFDEVKAKYEAAKAGVEQAEAAVKSAQGGLAAASANLKYGAIRAPFDGCISMKTVHKGDLASPGIPLMMLSSPPYEIDLNLPASYFGKVKVGDTFPVVVENIPKQIKATVVEVSSAVDPMSRTFLVKLSLPNEKGLTSGLFAKVLVPSYSQKETVLIPESAIYKWNDLTAVWLVDKNNIAHLQFVRLGQRYGNEIEVLSGLNPGDRIVVNNVYKVCDSCKIE